MPPLNVVWHCSAAEPHFDVADFVVRKSTAQHNRSTAGNTLSCNLLKSDDLNKPTVLMFVKKLAPAF
jgi:hypothetical protein